MSATEAVREAIEALAIDLAGVTPTPFAPLVPTEAEIERNAGRKLTLRKRASAPYTLASDDSLVEYLARRIARASAGPASAAHRGD